MGLHAPAGGGGGGGDPWPTLAEVGPAADPQQFDDSFAPLGAVIINPADDWTAKRNTAGVGGTLYVNAGTYVYTAARNINPLAGQTWIAQRSADGTKQVHVDGGGAGVYLFRGATGVDDVTIRGFDAYGFVPTSQTSVIQPYQGNSEASYGDRWDVRFNDVHDNANIGIRPAGNDPIFRANHTYANGVMGFGGANHFRLDLGYNEINDHHPPNPGFEGGALKFVLFDDVHVHHNYVHDNEGPGIWFDIAGLRGRVEDNYCVGGWGYPDIFLEISFGPFYVRRNYCGPGITTTFNNAPIFVAGTEDVEIYDNLIDGAYQGITLQQHERQEEPIGAPRGLSRSGYCVLSNVHVHDNVLRFGALSSAGDRLQTGAFRVDGAYDDDYPAFFSAARGLVFEGNAYEGDARWIWNDSANRSWAYWQGAGMDLTGSLTP